MKNIIIAGPPRVGKSTLARKLGKELGCFVLGMDKLVAVFQGAYPQMDIRLNWNREKTAENLAPFLGHFLGTFSSADGRGLLPYSHGAASGNRFVLEGGYFHLEKIQDALKAYGMENLQDNFLLVGLVQNSKTAEELVRDFKQYDTEADWTYGFDDAALREIAQDVLTSGRALAEQLARYGFTVYDSSHERERVLAQILEDIKGKAGEES